MSPPANEAETASTSLAVIDGGGLTRAFAGGAATLRQQASALNAINVFPVPDGDTGTNMSLTMSAAAEAVERSGATTAGGVAKEAAAASLMSAKGNSGVILSQILAGFAAAISADAIDAATLARAFERAKDAAYRVVSKPREGTILTAIADASASAQTAVSTGALAEAALAAAVKGAQDAVARTPELLPVLKEAGVVDAGAQGLFVFLEGMLRGLRGEAIEVAPADYGSIDESWLAAREESHGAGAQAGFCTEFVVRSSQELAALKPDAIRSHLETMGESLLVIGDADLVRVHVHTTAPDEVFAYGRSLGDVSHEKADDMEKQFASLAARVHGEARKPVTGVAVVAIAAGDGIAELMMSIGAATVVRGGQTMNPSAGEIRAAIEATGSTDVIVLPNNKNVILAAELAAKDLAENVRIVPSCTIPQGVAAIVAMNPELSLADNAEAMQEAIASVRSGEVTLAARATRVRGKGVEAGQPIGLVDGDLVVAEASVADAVHGCVAIMVDGRDTPIVTLYAGEGEDGASADAIADALRAEFSVEVEVVAGGQPHYPYLIGVE